MTEHSTAALPRLRVLICIEASRLDGPIRNLLYAVELLRQSVEFQVVTFARPGLEDNDLVRHLRDCNLPCEVISERRSFDPRAALRFVRILRAARADVVQVHHMKSRLFSLVSAVFLRVIDRRRLLFFFHGETWIDRKQHLYNHVDRMLFRWPARVVAVSPAQVETLMRWGVHRDRIVIIANVIPERPPRATPVRAAGEPYRVMCAGRLSAEKGQAVLIKALALLPAALRRQLAISVFGDGPDRDRLQALIEEQGVGEQITLCGYCNDLWPRYLQSDLFVLPSLSEGLPNVLLEAAMAGVPIVASGVGGVPALFDDNWDVRLVRGGDPRALAKALVEFLGNRAQFEEYASRARERVIGRYTPRAKADALARLYRELALAQG